MALQNKDRLQYLAIGAILSLMFTVPLLKTNGYFGPIPFSYVSTDSVEVVDNNLEISATFLKTDQCIFDSLGVFGEKLGQWNQLDWVDVNGEKGDRLEGYHTLNLAIDVSNGPYTKIQVRTRHECGGVKKDSIFLEVDKYK